MSLAPYLIVAGLFTQPGLPPENPRTVGAPTEDGVIVVGDYHAAPQPNGAAVILLHMYRSDRSAWEPMVPVLLNHGYSVLALDLRGHGDSTRPSSLNLERRANERDATLFNAMHHDVAAAYNYLAQQSDLDLSRFAVIGASVGCSVALDYARRDASVDVIVCMTPGTNYLGVDSQAHIAELRGGAILMLATDGERKATDALAALNPSVTKMIVGEGRVHGTRMFGSIDGIDSRILNFLNANIGQPTVRKVRALLGGKEYFSISSIEEMDVSPQRLRWVSSVEEARARGLTGADSASEGMREDSTRNERRDLVLPPAKIKPDDPN